ncbi:hypothetical protein D3C85_1727490 [compost metagenome]
MTLMDKQRFLVCYDYGMGGLWAFIYARSSEEILGKYPELFIATEQPGWMDENKMADIESRESHDIDGEPFGVLRVVIEERGHD